MNNLRRAGRMLRRLMLCAAWPCLSQFTAQAGQVVQMDMAGQPLQYSKEGRIDGCGVRVVGVTAAAPGVERIFVLDASFNFYVSGIGAIKGGLLETTSAALLTNKLTGQKSVKTTNIWMKAEGGKMTRPVRGGPMRSPQDKGAWLYPTALEEVLGLVAAMQEKKAIQVGFAVPARDTELVFFGVVKMDAANVAQFEDCFAAAAATMREKSEQGDTADSKK